ncbi:MAG: nucleotidyltransferase family protein [Acidobacteriota bacterium]|nr:MAG: nucleotidyltransferase family protein [Acidobacteriota bacterium]
MRERFIRDLDVLIPPAQFDVTETIFKQLGFVRDPQPRGEEFYRDWHFHMPWRTPSGLVVELHWDLTRRSDPFHIDVLPLCRSVREEQVSHHELPVHELSVALLLSCLQLYQESFLFLNRFVDIDWLARRSSEDDWDRLRGLATRGGMNTLVFAALETSHRLFDTPIPKRVRDRLSPGPVTRAVVRSLALHHHVARPVPIEDLTAEWLPRLWTCPTLVSRVCLLARFLRLDDGYWWDIFHRPRREVSHANRWRARGRRLMTLLQVLLRHVLGLRSGHPSPRGRLPLGDTFAAKKQRPGNEGR